MTGSPDPAAAATDPPAPPELPRLHVPDEPTARKATWHEAVLAGEDPVVIITGAEGGALWLWTRWRVLETVGFKETGFVELVGDYRREILLWLGGDRTWEQCCSGLIGRIGRRVPS